VLGAYDDSMRPVLAGALAELGTKRAWVLRSTDGMDEISPYATTRITELRDGKLSEIEIAPEDFGIEPSAAGAIRGAEPADNARVFERVLTGEPHPSRDAFVLNAAAALVVASDLPPKTAADRAREVLENGEARRLLETWRAAALAARGAA
jgi:anthranilate phosphoribosyltransferase